MGKYTLIVVLLFIVNNIIRAQNADDSTKVLTEVIVTGERSSPYEEVTTQTKIRKEYVSQNSGRDLSENLIVSPSVFNTRSGGGAGDSKAYIRGLGMADNGISINGVPLEIPFGSYVFWSNWLNIGYFTNSISLSKGLPSTNGMQNSLGGAVMIQLENPDTLNRLILSSNFSNSMGLMNGFKYSLSSTNKKTRATLGGNYTKGNQYFDNSKINGGSYFLHILSEVSKKYSVEFICFGSPQAHWQRSTQLTMKEYEQYGIRYNPDAGNYQGKLTSSATNFYHRPFFLFNQSYQFSSKTKLQFALNYLHGDGGALRSFSTPIPRNNDGSLNFDSAYTYNNSNIGLITLGNGSSFTAKQSAYFLGNFKNIHNRVGYNLSLNHLLNEKTSLNFNHYYYYQKEINYAEVADLLGGDGIMDYSDPNTGARFLKVGDKLWYNGTHTVHWRGANIAFNTQYKKILFYTFVEGMNMEHKNTEAFTLPVNGSNTSISKNVWGGSAKAGLSYALSKSNLLFVNGAIMKRVPFTSAIYIRPIQAEAKPSGENVKSVEVGWKLKKIKWQSAVNIYYTNRNNITRNYSLFDPGTSTYINGNIPGISSTYKGVEIELHFNLFNYLQLGSSVGISEYMWDKDVNAILRSPSGNPLDTVNLRLNNLPIGNVPMNTFYVYTRFTPFLKTSILVEYYGVGRYSSDFSVGASNTKFTPWQIPSYSLVNISTTQIIAFSKKATMELRFQINNLLNAHYVTEAIDGVNHDAQTALVYYGLGRNYSVGLQFSFR